MTTIPTFFVKGDTIVEVAYTEWEETTPGEWNCKESDKIPLSANIDRIVFELPVGCYQLKTKIFGGNGNTVTLEKSRAGGHEVTHCTQKAHFKNEIKQTEDKSAPKHFPHPEKGTQ